MSRENNRGIDLTIVSSGSEEDVQRALAGPEGQGKKSGSESGDDSGTSKKAAAGKTKESEGDHKSKTKTDDGQDGNEDDDQDGQSQDQDDQQDQDEDDQDQDADGKGSVDDDDDQDEDGKTDDDDADDDADNKGKDKTKPKAKGIQKRINKLVGRLNQTSQELAKERQLRQEAEARATQRGNKDGDSRKDDDDDKGGDRKADAKPIDVGPKPKVKDFDTYDDYLEKLAEWSEKALEARVAKAEAAAEAKAQAKIDKILKDQENERTKREQTDAKRLYDERQEAAREKYEDFDEVMQTTDVQVSQAVMHYINNHKHGQDLAYYLAHPDHEKEAKKLFRLPVDEQLLWVAEKLKGFAATGKPKNNKPVARGKGKGEDEDEGSGAGQKPGKPSVRKSGAPPPPPPRRAGGKPSSGVKDSEYYSNLSYEDYRKERSKGGSLYRGRD